MKIISGLLFVFGCIIGSHLVGEAVIHDGVSPQMVGVASLVILVLLGVSELAGQPKKQQEHGAFRGSRGPVVSGEGQTVSYRGPDATEGVYDIRPVRRDDI